jgi:predicted TIM-barrel fold metal-dependent hydrolase
MNQQTTRRNFLKQGSLFTAAVAVGAGFETNDAQAIQKQKSTKKEKPVDLANIPIIDTHQHLWDLKKFKLLWVNNDGLEKMNRSYLPSDYQKATAGLNVVKTVYMEVDVHPSQQNLEVEYVTKLCKQADNPMAAAVVSGRPNSAEFKAYVTPLADNPYIKGIRQVLHSDSAPRKLCLQPQFVESMKLLGDLGLSYDLCMRPGEIIDAVELVDKCPNTKFIIDHCGNMPVENDDRQLRKIWKQSMREMAQRDNVVCKISGIVVTAKENWKPSDLAPNINFCMDTFGEDRAYFAGDWPVCTLKASYAQWVGALKTIVKSRTPGLQKKLFHDNAARIYGLS